MATSLPYGALREAEKSASLLVGTHDLSMGFINKLTGEILYVGGVWDNIAKKYVHYAQDAKKIIPLTEPQWTLLNYTADAMYNDNRMERGIPPIQDIIMHGGRRSGKSRGALASALLVALSRPGSLIWIFGLRKRHGDNIIKGIKRALPNRLWKHDKHNNILRLVNGTAIQARSAVNYDADRGESLTCLILDEAAFMSEAVHDTLLNSLADQNGFAILPSSPNMLNWYYRLAEKSEHPDPMVRESVRTVQARASDNIFVKNLGKRMEFSKYVLSESAYRQEVEGAFMERAGLLFPQFDKDLHIRPSLDIIDDVTEALTLYMFGKEFKYIIGVDYNINPTASVIMKVDKRGHIWYLDELLSDLGTEMWGKALHAKLEEMGCRNPFQDAVIVGDSSGEWQDPKKGNPSHIVLRQQGWSVFRPQIALRRNPGVRARMEMMRSLIQNAAGEARLWVDPQCVNLIQSLREHPLSKEGKPDKGYKGNHIYDGASYPVFRIWGTPQGEKFFGFKLVARLDDKNSDD